MQMLMLMLIWFYFSDKAKDKLDRRLNDVTYIASV